MGESLTERHRVGDEGLRVVNPFSGGRISFTFTLALSGREHQLKKKKSWKLFLILLGLEILFLGGWGIRARLDINQIQDKVKLVKEDIHKLEEENQRLKDIVKNLTNPFYIEKQAREKLGLAKKGEIIYKIVSP